MISKIRFRFFGPIEGDGLLGSEPLGSVRGSKAPAAIQARRAWISEGFNAGLGDGGM